MREHFDIPIIERDKKTLYDIYIETDYSVFNNSFAKKYDNFETFLITHGIVNKVISHNSFFTKSTVDVTAGNHNKLNKLNDKLQQQQLWWNCYDKIISLKRQMFRKT